MAILRSGNIGWVILLVCVGYISKCEGFKQFVWLYDDEGRDLQLGTHEPDLSRYDFFLKTVTSYCADGYWIPYTSTNFEGSIATSFGLGVTKPGDSGVCGKVNATNFKSIRFLGASNTDTEAISLYKGINLNEEEILVTQEGAYTDITHEIQSFAVTGNSVWMLFEGANLDGNSYCYGRPAGWYINWDRPTSFNLTTVGSVFKGCHLPEIQAYKAKHLV